jgi:trans-aconitate 2-methyltransferase
VLHWIRATALRPVREALDPQVYADFEAELAPKLRSAYPADTAGGTWFPFRRVFAVATAR